MTTKQRRVVCAAIRAADGEVLIGIRHYSPDMHAHIKARFDGEKFCHRKGEDQGFVDQYGVYLTRKEAWHVAYYSCQIAYPNAAGGDAHCPELYSECLY